MQQAVQVLANADAWYSRVIMGLVTIGLAPIAEEVLFRGILFPAVKRRYPRGALWMISFLFGLIHFNLATFLPLFVMGVMLARLYETTGNLLAPITLHCLFNAVNFLLFFFGQYLPDWVLFTRERI
jgi:membrane protease YdiL (CAAX protease family)